jgi:hypothetical protein
MVTKKTSEKAKKRRVKVGKLQLNKETIKELTPGKQKQVKGGAAHIGPTVILCFPTK